MYLCAVILSLNSCSLRFVDGVCRTFYRNNHPCDRFSRQVVSSRDEMVPYSTGCVNSCLWYFWLYFWSDLFNHTNHSKKYCFHSQRCRGRSRNSERGRGNTPTTKWRENFAGLLKLHFWSKINVKI